MYTWSQNKMIAVAFLGGLVASISLGALLIMPQQNSTAEREAFTKIAQSIVADCAEESYRPSCYDIEIPKYMDRGYSMEETFAITKEVQKLDDAYQYCHVLGHYLSQKETAKDPSKWKDVVARAPHGICSNGAIHGAFLERFRADSLPDASLEYLEQELRGVCEKRESWDPTQLERGSCLHALGHLTMYVTDGDIDKSLALCDILIQDTSNRRGDVQLCYDGAFMQIFQPLEPEDFALVDHFDVDTQAKASDFCNAYTAEQFGSCTSESWPLYNEELLDPGKISSICSPVEGTGWQEERCLMGVFYVLVSQMNLDSDRVFDYCDQITPGLTNHCFEIAVSRMLEVDWDNTQKAINLCERASDVTEDAQEACFNKLVSESTFSFKPGSPEFIYLCEHLPSGYQERCFAKM